jgi:hypothetical protein
MNTDLSSPIADMEKHTPPPSPTRSDSDCVPPSPTVVGSEDDHSSDLGYLSKKISKTSEGEDLEHDPFLVTFTVDDPCNPMVCTLPYMAIQGPSATRAPDFD